MMIYADANDDHADDHDGENGNDTLVTTAKSIITLHLSTKLNSL